MNVVVRAFSVVAVCAAAGCSATVAGDVHPGEPARESAALQDLLLIAEEINTAMNAGDMVADTTQSMLVDDGGRTKPTECLAASSVGQEHVYSDSGWTAIRIQSVHEAGEDFEHLAHQAVVEFPSQAAATAFLSRSADAWRACARTGRYTYNPGPQEDDVVWLVAPVEVKDSMLTTATPQQGSDDGWTCQRALTAAVNVVADVMTCSYDVEDKAAATIARHIADRVVGQ